MIITIGREYGSNGHRIGELVAKKLGFTLYDKKSLEIEAKKTDYYDDLCSFYEEQPVNSLLYMIATSSYNGGKQGKVPFEFIRQVASRESCVIIGRAGNYILRDHPEHVSVFIHAPQEATVERMVTDYGVDAKKALQKLELEDKAREGFHTYYTDERWNLATGYDLCIDSSTMSAEDIAEIIIAFAKKKLKVQE